MLTLDYVHAQLKIEGRIIGEQARNGCKRAFRVIEWYEMHYRCPGDPGAQMFLILSYEEYKKGESL